MKRSPFFVVPFLLVAALGLWGHLNATADPVVRRALIAEPAWPRGAPPTRMLLMSDIHFGNWSMNASRLERIVGQANALHPDLVVIAGDFLAGYDNKPTIAAQLVRPLSELRAPLGVVAVLGNHDRKFDPSVVIQALKRAGITLLLNQAVRRGPLAVGGAADGFHWQALVETARHMRGIDGVPILVAHEPDSAAGRPHDMPLMLVGHTHCGQIVLPVIGPLTPEIVKNQRYLCGFVRDAIGATVVTGGLGTSEAPFRFGAPPDMWLLTIGPTVASRP